MPDLLDEISDELRAERTQALFLRFGWVALAACLVIVLATAGWQAWDWARDRRMSQAATVYFAALHQSPPGAAEADRLAALAQLAGIDHGATGAYRSLARLQEAALKDGLGDKAGALASWNAVATDKAADPLLRQLADLAWAQHQPGPPDDAEAIRRLRALSGMDNPWHGLAQEMLASRQLQAGKIAEARQIFARLQADPTVTEGVRGRAAMVLAETAP